jgi:hypothetical protein
LGWNWIYVLCPYCTRFAGWGCFHGAYSAALTQG